MLRMLFYTPMHVLDLDVCLRPFVVTTVGSLCLRVRRVWGVIRSLCITEAR